MNNPKIKAFTIIIFLIICFASNLCSGQSRVQKALILKDGSIIKGQIIEQDEYSLKIVNLKGDTSEYSFKYIQEIVQASKLDTNKANLKRKSHKTEGTFVQLNYGFPISIEIGRRVSDRLNIGGQKGIPIIEENNTEIFSSDFTSIAGYCKYYLNKEPYDSRFFIDGQVGVIVNRKQSDGENSIKPYMGSTIGIHLASKKKVRFFFKLGSYLYYDTRDEILRNPFRVIRNKSVIFHPSFTILGIEF